MTEEGFSKAQSDNLPKIDGLTVAEYIKNNDCLALAEVRGVKADRSGRQSYGDAAIGWVQVRRENQICTVKGKITPEHNVRSKQYSITMTVDETTQTIQRIDCHDCAASLGGCKHSIAFLMWVHRRSEEPSPTEVTCYWNRSTMSKIGTSVKFVTLADFGEEKSMESDDDDGNFLNELVSEGVERSSTSQLLKHFKTKEDLADKLGLHQLMSKYIAAHGNNSVTDFITFCSNIMQNDSCIEAAKETVEQTESSLWYELRYARITASKIYGAAHCNQTEGVFIEHILGVSKVIETSAMERGKRLEKEVLKTLEKIVGTKLQSIGLKLIPNHPIFGASQDAICNEYVVEIKCPLFDRTVSNYLTKEKAITARYMAQVQLQMHIFEKKKCLFCLADPNFETNKNITYIFVDYNFSYIMALIEKAEEFWSKTIFPQLYNSAVNV